MWFSLSSGLLFKCVLSFSGPLYPLPCFEILLLGAELIKRSESEQHLAPRTWGSWGSLNTKLTTHHQALRGRPAPLQKDQALCACWEDAPLLPGCSSPLCRVCFCLLGQRLTPLSPLYKPVHLKRPVSHGFQAFVEGPGVFSARASRDPLNPETKIPWYLELFLSGCRGEGL
jgi:hypothetical protein